MRTRIMALLGLAAIAAVSAPSPGEEAAAAHDALRRGRYLEADHRLGALALNADGSLRDEGAFGSWEQIHPMLTNELPVGGLYPTSDPVRPPDPAALAALAAARPVDALGLIVQRAAKTTIVFLNEAHDSPRDRAFALTVARALRPLGYSFLAAETFNNDDRGRGPSPVDTLMRDGFVRRGTGYYTADPVFAGFVRVALRSGYRPIAYEQTVARGLADPGQTIAQREQAEAANLEAVLRAYPGMKMLVYVGYHHAAEAAIGRGDQRNDWMAARLKQATGIDPLTIDQTGVTDTSRAMMPLQAAAAARITRPSVFMAGGAPLVLGDLAGAVDLQVIHPARRYRNGRPTWLGALGGRPIAVPAGLLPRRGERLVQAFAADAPDDAVPLDQVLVEAGNPAPKLMVPREKLRLAFQDPG